MKKVFFVPESIHPSINLSSYQTHSHILLASLLYLFRLLALGYEEI